MMAVMQIWLAQRYRHVPPGYETVTALLGVVTGARKHTGLAARGEKDLKLSIRIDLTKQNLKNETFPSLFGQ